MRNTDSSGISFAVVCRVFLVVAVVLVLVFIVWEATFFGVGDSGSGGLLAMAVRSFGLAAIIAGAAVVLGWVPGRLLGTCRRGRDVLLMLLLMPLVLPRYVLYYAWSLLLTPTSCLGRYLSTSPEVARGVWTVVSSSVLVLWYWPLAALLLGQGWRGFDRRIRDCASLDAGGWAMFRGITLPVLGRSIMLAFGVCFALIASEFGAFHLAGVRTIGAELAVVYQLTGSEWAVLRAAWPVVIVALVAAVGLGRSSRGWGSVDPAVETVEFKSQGRRWGVLFGLLAISLVAPVVLLIGSVEDSQAFRQFFALHTDELAWSLGVSVAAALGAYLIGFGAVSLGGGRSAFGRAAAFVVSALVFLAMFLPASVVAAGLLRLLAASHLPGTVRQGWYVVSAGHAARFAGVTLVLLQLARGEQERQLVEMARLDGASRFEAWRRVELPRTWPLVLGALILVVMLSITELSATMVLLPAGLPNFAQRLLNQMHYAGDQQVIASCLVLICLFAALSGVVAVLLRAVRVGKAAVPAALLTAAVVLGGCEGKGGEGEARVVDAFGRTGRGAGEFVYPRAIDIAGDNTLVVVDKTGRIQRLDRKGGFIDVVNMAQVEAGKPTGLSVHPNGNIYVADTHYHRIVVLSGDGELISEFGKLGEEEGCFIYPTDVAFAGDGRIFVSEYGGNDRISVFSEKNEFLYCFGSNGSGRGELSRPSAMSIDEGRKRLYIADACNHRIAVYGLDCKLIDYIGSAGREAGQLRYPYDLALLDDGTLAVCEFGNNRIQLLSPDGRSLAIYGQAGRELGQLAYPWGVAVDKRGQAFIVDAGNNRIQVWQL